MLTVDLHSCDTSKTFALSIEHNFLLLLLASLKAYSEILSISETLYLIVLKASVLLLANRKHFEHCFGQELLKVAKVEDEMQLDFALEHYLSMEENAPLLKAFNERDEARKQHENTKSELDSLSSIVATLFASVRW